jgi:hypothetical protein
METILLLLALFALLKAVLATSLLPGVAGKIAWGVACAAFVVACHPRAIASSKVMLERALGDIDAVRDLSVVVMVDLLLLIGFIHSLLQEPPARGYARVGRYLPGLLLFPALYYLHVTLFFRLPGAGFATVTALHAVGAGVLVGGGGVVLDRWMPGREARLELTVIVALLVFALAVCCTVFHPSSVIHAGAAM